MKNFFIKLIVSFFYSKKLPYHNFDHVLFRTEIAKIIIEDCRKEDLVVNEDVVSYALLGHDMGYHKDHKAKGFNTKEEYSSFLIASILRWFRISEKIVQAVKNAVLATHKDYTPTNIEEKIVRAADLQGMSEDYGSFLENTKKLKKETELLTGKAVFLDDFKKQTKILIGHYLSQDIHLTKKYYDENGNSAFHVKVKANLNRFLAESEESLNKGDVL